MADCPDAGSGPHGSKELLPSPWFLYDMLGNVAEIAISEADGVVRFEVLGLMNPLIFR
jgi:hypothetical protein